MTKKGHPVKVKHTESPVLPELEDLVTVTAAAQVSRSAKRGSGGRRGARFAAIGFACLAFGGTAMAATGVWDPDIGTEGSGRPPKSISSTPVPAEVAGVLGVFRREPTAQDRSPEVETALRRTGLSDGIRPDSVRYLAAEGNGEAAILFSTERPDDRSFAEEQICVTQPVASSPREPGGVCFAFREILKGYATAGFFGPDGTGTRFGLVPDGVATVTFEFPDASDLTVPVENNYFGFRLSEGEPCAAEGELACFVELASAAGEAELPIWRDADGRIVPH